MAERNLDQSVLSIKGIGDSSLEKLAKLNIKTLRDLIRFLPRKYLDYSNPKKIIEIKEKKTVSFIATIDNFKSFYTKTGKLISQAQATDDTGTITLIWFNNPYIKRLLTPQLQYTVAGTSSTFAGKLCLISPTIEEGDSLKLNTSGLVPVYPQTKGINSRFLRQKIDILLKTEIIKDPLEPLKDFKQDLPLQNAYKQIHFPKNKLEKKQADKRLSFNEHLSISIQNQIELQKLGASPSIKINQKVHQKGLKKFPFTLTLDQERATQSILKDLGSTSFTHRLVQGDTGSGKTATIILAANQCLENGFSCAILAPTQILSNQHYYSFKKHSLFPDSVSLITGNDKINIDHNMPRIYIGTQSLIKEIPQDLKHPLLFVVVDEQHKFGVVEREGVELRKPVPHVINLSATPIPRTVAQGLLGEIKLSNIKSKPQDRLQIKTHVVSDTYFKKGATWLNNMLSEGNKLYIVAPTIHNNSTTHSTESLAEKYRQTLTSDTNIFVIHGKVKPQDQKEILEKFTNTPRSVLVSTSLIEVGIDIPASNIIIIHSAERFGLAQLHQLRGRVGRSEKQGYCFLIPSTDDQVEIERLQLLKKYHSGLILAKKDLILRGSGEVFGQRQHGNLQTNLKYFWSKKSYQTAKSIAKSLIDKNLPLAESIASKLNYC